MDLIAPATPQCKFDEKLAEVSVVVVNADFNKLISILSSTNDFNQSSVLSRHSTCIIFYHNPIHNTFHHNASVSNSSIIKTILMTILKALSHRWGGETHFLKRKSSRISFITYFFNSGLDDSLSKSIRSFVTKLVMFYDVERI